MISPARWLAGSLMVWALFGFLPNAAHAGVLDLTTPNASGTINGGYFQQTDYQPTGTGKIDSFVRIQAKGIEQGYNTDYRPLQFDEKKDPQHTRSLLLSAVPIVNL